MSKSWGKLLSDIISDIDEKKKSEEARIVIDTFEKNSQEEIKLILTIYKGSLLLDIRAWRKQDAAFGAGNPTKRGISINLELLPRLSEAIVKAKGYIKDHVKEIAELEDKLQADNDPDGE